MLQYKYKTRGQSSPQGKPKVYFCCHADDFADFFESISDSILKISDCAVYYRDDANRNAPPSLEEMEEVFPLIKLFVIPVTKKFLTEPNSARETEFEYAIANNIPVLPLLQEAGLEYEFNKRCGDLHLINESTPQDMFSSYDQQLKKYIDRVLLNDTLADRIRSAFDAYIFLSYRKKDRKAAQRMMRLIHQNEFCRDVAIWYDEFLVPGENFNEGIRDALMRSCLFALAVTPRLLEENNYVMQIEFPMAKKENKPIFAVELEPTDNERLNECYMGLDYLINAAETQGITHALTKALLGESNFASAHALSDDASHLFLIGLAYLCGIDVEKDAARALSLIERASNAGLDEATQKLVDMYLVGDGVKRDTRRAYEYQRKLLSSKAKAYDDDPSKENALSFAEAIIETVQVAKISKALSAYGIKNLLKKQVGELEYITDEAGEWTDELKFNVAIIYGLMSESSQPYDLDEAIDYAWTAHNYLLDLAESSQDPEHIAALFIVTAELGHLNIKNGNEGEGLDWLSVCEDCLPAQLKKFPDNNSLDWAYIQALGAKSEYLLAKQDRASAKDINLKALDFAKRLYEKGRSERVRGTMVVILCELSTIELGLGNIQCAIERAAEALALQKEQKRFADKLKLYDCYRILARCYSVDDQYEKERESLELALQCLMEKESELIYTEELTVSNRLMDVYLALFKTCDTLGDVNCAHRYRKEYERLKRADEEATAFFSEDSEE